MATRFAASPSILNFMASSPNYGKLASVGAMENAKTEAQNLMSNAGIHAAGITGKADVKKAKYAGQAMIDQGEAAGHSAMMGGIASGIGSIAGGFMNRPKSYSGTGTGTIDTAAVDRSINQVHARETANLGFTPMGSGFVTGANDYSSSLGNIDFNNNTTFTGY